MLERKMREDKLESSAESFIKSFNYDEIKLKLIERRVRILQNNYQFSLASSVTSAESKNEGNSSSSSNHNHNKNKNKIYNEIQRHGKNKELTDKSHIVDMSFANYKENVIYGKFLNILQNWTQRLLMETESYEIFFGLKASHDFSPLNSSVPLSKLSSLTSLTYSPDGSSARVVLDSNEILHVKVVHGIAHGLYKLYYQNKIQEMGWFTHGQKTGVHWKFLKGGGFLIGNDNPDEEKLFVYPDHVTALRGIWRNGLCERCKTCFIRCAILSKELYHLTTTFPEGPSYNYCPGNRTVITSSNLLLQDPLEYQSVFVQASKISRAKEGLFAKKTLSYNSIVSFYNGIKIPVHELEDNIQDWKKDAYKIMDLKGPDDNGKEEVIDIPSKYISISSYCASLAHKTNHSFTPNAQFILFDHPRWGMIPAISIITESVAPNEEITVSYDYALNEAPPWYQELYVQQIWKSYKKSMSLKSDI